MGDVLVALKSEARGNHRVALTLPNSAIGSNSIASGEISGKIAKDVFAKISESGDLCRCHH